MNLVGAMTKLLGRMLRFTQTGMEQDYVLLLFIGVLMIAGFYLMK